MTFPVVLATGTYATNADLFTSHAITLPAHAAGDLILVAFGVPTDSTITVNSGSSSAGWSVSTRAGADTFLRGVLVSKTADSASETLTLTTTVNSRPGYVVYVIDAGTFTGFSFTVANATSGSANPPTITPSAGGDHLFIAAALLRGGTPVSAAPTDFSGLISQAAGTSAACSPAGATREFNTASAYDPSAFTAPSTYWIAYNIVVEGAAGPADTDPPVITSVVGTGGAEASSGTFTSDEAGTAFWKLTATSTPESVPAYPDAMTGWTSQAMTAGANSIASLTATPGTYWLQVAAQDDEATPNRVAAPTVSAASFEVTVAPSDTTPPSTPPGLELTLITKNSFIPVWEASTDDTAVTGYEYRVNGGSVVDAGDVLTVAAGITGLTPGAAYTFDVRAYDAAGNRSAFSSASTTLPLWGFAFSTEAGLDFGAIVGALTGVARETAGASWTIFVHNELTRALILTSSAVTIDANGRLPDFTSATLDPGTYFVSFRRGVDGQFAAARIVAVDLS